MKQLNLNLVNIDRDELQQLRAGDRLNLWTRYDLATIYVFRTQKQLGGAHIAELSKQEHPELAYMVVHRFPVWLEVETVQNIQYTLVAKLENDFSAHKRIERHAEKTVRLLQQPSNTLPLSFLGVLSAWKHAEILPNDRLALCVTPVEHYVREFGLEVYFFGIDGSRIRFQAPREQRIQLLQSHFCGVNVTATVVSVADGTIGRGDRYALWEEREATARVDFTR